ncbi:hypothetical protein Q6332_30865, partial [Klebsiella pneumoniae]|uniref:hypothetical protein n=1 Tax=Klebsiella pneumoniae TaxID=573 RepID=UPI002730825D
MFKRNPRSAAALAMIGALSGVAAFAQQAEPQKLERIEITGSRIKSISTESNTPVTSITKADIVSSQPVA